MRKSGILMMHAVVRFVKQRVSKQTAEPALRHNASGRAIYGVAGQPDVFDVFAPALKICRYQSRDQIQPEKIFPRPKKCDAVRMAVQTTTARASSAQILRLTLRLRTNECRQENAQENNGE